MYESPYQPPVEATPTSESQSTSLESATAVPSIESAFTESAFALALANISEGQLTVNNRPIRHHETSAF